MRSTVMPVIILIFVQFRTPPPSSTYSTHIEVLRFYGKTLFCVLGEVFVFLDGAEKREGTASNVSVVCIRCHQRGHCVWDCPITLGESDGELGTYHGTTETFAAKRQTSQGT